MVLNVIDFNNNLQKSYRNRYCIYRNLELGHEIHVYSENSALIKACQSTMDLDIKKTLSKMHFSPTYEYYKLFLMLHLEGWFIESDMIFYDLNLNLKKTSPCYTTIDNFFYISFCTWEPIFIKLDPTTKFFLKKSLETLKIFLKHQYFPDPQELSYQIIVSGFGETCQYFKEHSSKLGFCEHLYKTKVHCSNHNFRIMKVPSNTEHLKDFLLAKKYFDADNGKPCTEKVVEYADLLKFDTFKIMP